MQKLASIVDPTQLRRPGFETEKYICTLKQTWKRQFLYVLPTLGTVRPTYYGEIHPSPQKMGGANLLNQLNQALPDVVEIW